MAEENGRVVERILKTRQPDKAFPTWDEIVVIEADIALADLGAIKEMRPDLKDRDLAYLVRTADFDEDAEAWMRRVESYEAHSIDQW
jgi:hypothetical protein